MEIQQYFRAVQHFVFLTSLLRDGTEFKLHSFATSLSSKSTQFHQLNKRFRPHSQERNSKRHLCRTTHQLYNSQLPPSGNFLFQEEFGLALTPAAGQPRFFPTYITQIVRSSNSCMYTKRIIIYYEYKEYRLKNHNLKYMIIHPSYIIIILQVELSTLDRPLLYNRTQIVLIFVMPIT